MPTNKLSTAITRQWLEEQDACQDQVEVFRKEWGEEAELSQENLLQAAKLGLDLYWLARHLLPAESRKRLLEIAESRKRYWTEIAESRERYLAEIAEPLWRAICLEREEGGSQ